MPREMNLWELDLTNRISGVSWWWWWWLFFIDNPKDPKRPKQLMILWSTRDCRYITVNHLSIEPMSKDIVKREDRDDFHGAVASWYYDGRKMHHNFVLERCDLTVEKEGKKLYTHTENDHVFSERDGKYNVRIRKSDLDFDFHMVLDDVNELTRPVFLENQYWQTRLGFKIERLNRLSLTGTMFENGKKESITGSAYFQKVMVNAPAPPWYWSIVHFEDGSIASYFNPHAGAAMFKRDPYPMGRLTEFLNVDITKQGVFFNKRENKLYNFPNFKLTHLRNSKKLPLWVAEGTNEEGDSMRFVLSSYSRSYWRFEKPIKFFPFTTVLYYNEYPGHITDFELRSNTQHLTLKDLGRGVGNSEHTWGTLF